MATKREHQFLSVEVDLPTGKKPDREGDPIPTRRVGPGLLSELEISDEEVKKLPRGVVRDATVAEMEAAENTAISRKAREAAAAAAEEERGRLFAAENERRALERQLEDEKRQKLSELADRQAEEAAESREAAAEEINKAAGSGGKKTAKARR